MDYNKFFGCIKTAAEFLKEKTSAADLKAIAKARGLKGTSAMKKADLIELMLAEDEKDKAAGKSVQPKSVIITRASEETEKKEPSEVIAAKEVEEPIKEPEKEKTE